MVMQILKDKKLEKQNQKLHEYIQRIEHSETCFLVSIMKYHY
ncbi:11123_t:CDS:2 [Gigaspora margarita]|uniref:11123_t:CDS:1 n=1 Tax=Gigaspora margarita TaxID=4874 RepID=A0ABM8W5L7_GIGMA|nr:11123_t:CDS:2 [Gigaspora margarita]